MFRPPRHRSRPVAWRFVVLCALSAALLAVGAPRGLHAQLAGLLPAGPSRADTASAAEAMVAPDSPRASWLAFQQLVQQHRYASASQYLQLAATDSSRAELLARRLREVLDQRLLIEVARISPRASGDTADGMPDADRLGVIAGANGLPQAVRLTRLERDGINRWVFDAGTVSRIDGWYENLPDAWLRGRIPSPLLGEGAFGVYYWQWIGIVMALAVGLVLAAVLAHFAKLLLALVTARTATEWDELLISRLRGPFRLWLVGMLASPLLGLLGLNVRVAGFLGSAAGGVVILSLFWGVLRAITMVQEQLLASPWAAGQAQARTLVPLLSRFLRVAVAALALLVVLAQFGYPVGALLAGVGIGGIALALASQKTVENLFGSVSLAADRVFRVGDFVRVGEVEGTVERIGLRSTSVRTMKRTVIRIPNGKLAEERIETFGERDRFFMEHTLGVTYGTTASQLRAIMAAIEARLREHPALWPEVTQVHTVAFADSAIAIRVRAWFEVEDFVAFLDVQSELLLAFMEIVQDSGSSFAFPSRTVYNVSVDQAPAPEERQ